jgi:type I restriction enzyme M protein
MGSPISRTQIEFSPEEIERIGNTFESWANGKYEDEDGYCKSVSRADIAKNGDALSPGRYIGTEDSEAESDEDFETRMSELTTQLSEQLKESHSLEDLIKKQLKGLGYDF